MNQQIKLLLALNQVKNISNLVEGNEYEKYMISHLIQVRVELSRQLTNLTQSSKIKE